MIRSAFLVASASHLVTLEKIDYDAADPRFGKAVTALAKINPAMAAAAAARAGHKGGFAHLAFDDALAAHKSLRARRGQS